MSDDAPRPPGGPGRPPARFWGGLIAATVLVGALLRVSNVPDIEWKGDERWMFARTERVGRGEPWPMLGMKSGVGLPNPGASVWAFVVLARVTGAHEPPELARAVMVMNVLALGALIVFAMRVVRPAEREPWLWAAALAAANPVALLLHRKIWAQSLLPLLCVVMWIAWWRRDRRWGAGLWGVLGALIGQIHMSGMFFTAALVGWEATAGRLRRDRPRTRWGYLLGGAALAALPAWPWVKAVLAGPGGQGRTPAAVFSGAFARFIGADATGLGLDYSLGGAHLKDLGRWPLLPSGGATHLVLAAEILAAAAAVAVLALWLGTRRDALPRGDGPRAWLARARAAFSTLDETGFAVGGALVAYGLLITLPGFTVFRHYLIVTFPMIWVALARLGLRARGGRGLLAAIVVCNLFVSLAFLAYIHEHHGAPGGDYGVGWRWQR